MKRIFLLLLVLLTAALFAQAQTFELRLRPAGGSLIAVEMRETSGNPPKTADILTDLVFGICWDKSYGIDLGAVSTDYTIRKAGPEISLGNLEYQQFAKDPNPIHLPADWSAGQWAPIMTISNNMAATQTHGVFSVCPLPIQELNINYNLVDYKVTAGEAAAGVRIGMPGAQKPKDADAPGAAADAPAPAADRSGWTLTPNPTTGHFLLNLRAPKDEDVQLSVTDAAGKVIFLDIVSLRAGANSFPVRLDGAAAGMHQVTLRWSDGDTQSKQLVVND